MHWNVPLMDSNRSFFGMACAAHTTQHATPISKIANAIAFKLRYNAFRVARDTGMANASHCLGCSLSGDPCLSHTDHAVRYGTPYPRGSDVHIEAELDHTARFPAFFVAWRRVPLG